MTDIQDQAVDATLADMERAEQLVERLLASYVGGIEVLTIELGRRLGLYGTIHAAGSVNATELARAAGIAVRYAREWLEQQGAAGLLDVVDVTADADERRFVLPLAHAPVLLDEEHPAHVVGLAPLFLATAQTVPAVATAFRNGTGVSYADYGADLRHGIASTNRPGFTHQVRAWVDAMPDVAARLDEGGVVLDAGCGEGWSAIGIALAFPNASVVGVDLDVASIAEARGHAARAGLADRVSFVVANASDQAALAAATGGQVSLVTVFQALHDMGRPAEALAAFRAVLADHGTVFIGDEAGGEQYAAPSTELERLQYAMSVLHCLPATWAEDDSHPNGTVLRPSTVRGWAEAAGYTDVQVLDIEHPFWRFFRL